MGVICADNAAMEIRQLVLLPCACVVLGCGIFAQAPANNAAQANAHDDAWQDAWVAHARSLHGSEGKAAGMVLHVGDSITHANPYGQWARFGSGRTAEDLALARWCHAPEAFPPVPNDPAQINGWYLAAADTSSLRGMTAAGGLRTDELLAGEGNDGPAMPASNDPAESQRLVADGAAYPGNLRLETLAAAFSAAEFAIVLLGTNDASAGRPARDRALAFIDFEAEILARRPGDSWNGTLLRQDDVHPSGSGAGFNSSSNPYTPGNGRCLSARRLLAARLADDSEAQGGQGAGDRSTV
jgi:hypothetical protein